MAGLVIRTFLVDGEPEGLRTMELSNATVLGTLFPRPALSRFVDRPAAKKPGVYLLFGADTEASDPTSERVYIGEGDPVVDRLRSHAVQKEFWTQAAVFTSKDDYLTKTQIQFLEASLISSAKSAARVALDNANIPTLPNISEADRAEVETFLGHVEMLLGVAGYHLLRPRLAESLPAGQEFHLSAKDAAAVMVQTTTGYMIRKGSTAVAELAPSCPPFIGKARERLMQSSTLVPDGADLLRFAEDAVFNSPSTAAMMVSGNSISGPKSWRLSNGMTLAEVEEAETADQGTDTE